LSVEFKCANGVSKGLPKQKGVKSRFAVLPHEKPPQLYPVEMET
jgi:hypothetical protein